MSLAVPRVSIAPSTQSVESLLTYRVIRPLTYRVIRPRLTSTCEVLIVYC